MTWVAVGVLLFLGAHFAGTYLVPADEGRASFAWPWARDPSIWARLADRGPLVPVGWQVLQPVAAVAAFAYLGALLALLGWLVPAAWMQPLAAVGAGGSLALYAIHPGPLAIVPIAVDIVVLWGVVGLGWASTGLTGG